MVENQVSQNVSPREVRVLPVTAGTNKGDHYFHSIFFKYNLMEQEYNLASEYNLTAPEYNITALQMLFKTIEGIVVGF